jgi:hypothetical protein
VSFIDGILSTDLNTFSFLYFLVFIFDLLVDDSVLKYLGHLFILSDLFFSFDILLKFLTFSYENNSFNEFLVFEALIF